MFRYFFQQETCLISLPYFTFLYPNYSSFFLLCMKKDFFLEGKILDGKSSVKSPDVVSSIKF